MRLATTNSLVPWLNINQMLFHLLLLSLLLLSLHFIKANEQPFRWIDGEDNLAIVGASLFSKPRFLCRCVACTSSPRDEDHELAKWCCHEIQLAYCRIPSSSPSSAAIAVALTVRLSFQVNGMISWTLFRSFDLVKSARCRHFPIMSHHRTANQSKIVLRSTYPPP